MTRLRNFIARTLHRLAERITPDLSIAIDESVFRELAERDAIREAALAERCAKAWSDLQMRVQAIAREEVAAEKKRSAAHSSRAVVLHMNAVASSMLADSEVTPAKEPIGLESNPPPAEVSCEDQKKRRRGRPFGTGIDDTSHLDAIARLMAEHPSLSPTTAIRMLGISDRSVIRRLRDKFKARQNGSSMP